MSDLHNPRSGSSPSPAPEFSSLFAAAIEDAGVELVAVARKTRISMRNLRALRDGRIGDLPAPVYVRGYLRSIAGELGVDPEPWLAAYTRCQPDEKLAPQFRVRGGMFDRPLLADHLPVPVRVGHVVVVLSAILGFFLLYFALEGRGQEDASTASSQDSSLIELLDTRPIHRR